MMEQENTPTILLTDDDKDTRAILRAMLNPVGANIVEASDGSQALAILASERVDVIVSDLVMPKMSGLMLLHSMLEKGMHTPFILLSGFSDKDSAIQALRLGAFDYLEKPVHESDLQPVIHEALKLSQQQRIWQRAASTQATPRDYDHPDRQAEIQIMRMRVMRPTTNIDAGTSTGVPIEPENHHTWRELKDLFLREAQAQLAFSDVLLKELKSSKQVVQDLTMALRVFQSLRIGAEAMRFSDLAAFTWSLEATIAAFRRRPRALNESHIKLMLEANVMINRKLETLGDLTARKLQETLVDLALAVTQDKIDHAA